MNNNTDEYNWDFKKLFIDDNEFYKAIDKVKEYTEEIVSMKGHILDDDSSLLKFYDINEKLNILFEKIYIYSSIGHDQNLDDRLFQEKYEKALSIYDLLSSKLSFITPELLKKDIKYVNSLIKKNKELNKYKFDIEKTFRRKEHVLSEKEENILASTNSVLRGPDEIFTSLNDIDAYFDNIIDEDGNSVVIDQSSYGKYIESKDLRVRKDAFESMYKYYKNHINALSSMYISNIKGDTFISKLRHYNSTLEESLYGDNLDKSLYLNLINTVDENVNSLQKYYNIKSKVLGVEKIHMYDLYVNIADLPKKVVLYEDAKKILFNALKPLGEDYLKNAKKIINNRCIDVYPKKSKKSGGYQTSAYGVLPFILLNYENNMNSASTFIHELGHAMHTYYSDKNNIYCYASYPIFLAEIASTVNEILLSEYMYNNSDNIDEKIYYLVEYLDKFKATVFRQTMFAEFEYLIHDKYEKGVSLTKDLLCDTYYELNKKHFSSSVEVDESIKYEWSRIPHFYSSFYVYKYATSFISSTIIANKLLTKGNEFRKKYIDFLSSGGKDYPLNTLKKLGIDITNIDVLNGAFEIFNNKTIELEELLKEKGVM